MKIDKTNFPLLSYEEITLKLLVLFKVRVTVFFTLFCFIKMYRFKQTLVVSDNSITVEFFDGTSRLFQTSIKYN